MEDTPVRIAIITPQPVVEAGLRTMLAGCEHPSEVIALAADGAEPDVVLYDVMALLSGDGTDLDIVVGKTASAVLAISRELRPDLLAQALKRGVDGFFPLGATEPEVCAAIASTQTGWKVGDTGENPVVGARGSAAHADQVGANQGLTEREREVLALIAQGYSNVEIAGEIHLGINTIKTHIRGAYRKIGATNRAEAVAWAIRHGLPSQFR